MSLKIAQSTAGCGLGYSVAGKRSSFPLISAQLANADRGQYFQPIFTQKTQQETNHS